MGIPPIDLQVRVQSIWEIDRIELKVKETIHRIKKSFTQPLDFINENGILTYYAICLLDQADYVELFKGDVNEAETEFFYLCEYLGIRYPRYNFYICQSDINQIGEWHLMIQKINEETEHLLWKNSLPRVN